MPKVHPLSHVHADAQVAEDVTVGPFCNIEKGVVIGSGCTLDSHVTVKQGTTIGERNYFGQGAIIGGDPQDLKYRGEHTTVEIGENMICTRPERRSTMASLLSCRATTPD